MKPILIIKTGTTYAGLRKKEGDFEHWIKRSLPHGSTPVKTISAVSQPYYPPAKQLAGIIITGSHNNVTEQTNWMQHLKEYIRQAGNHNIPMLGICFGHQILADAFGGKVKDNPEGGEFGYTEVSLTRDTKNGLVSEVPRSFFAYVSHGQSVIKLPEGAVPLAKSKADNHHIVNYKKNIWGIQFHPEFNREITAYYTKRLTREPLKVSKKVSRSVKNSSDKIMGNLIRLCRVQQNLSL